MLLETAFTYISALFSFDKCSQRPCLGVSALFSFEKRSQIPCHCVSALSSFEKCSQRPFLDVSALFNFETWHGDQKPVWLLFLSEGRVQAGLNNLKSQITLCPMFKGSLPGLPNFSWHNIPKLEMQTKWPRHIPNSRKIYQMVLQYSKWPYIIPIFFIPRLSNSDFWYVTILSGNPDRSNKRHTPTY
jgi:hypothetical protein